jgi:hypothetical protein
LALNIFRDEADQPRQKNSFADDVVGTFRAGHVDENGNPASLDTWRVTTGDPEVADAIADLLKGDAPAEWDTKSEETLEVYTEASSVYIVLEDAKAVRQRFVQRNRNGEFVYTSDGATKDDGEPDPHAKLSLNERFKLAADGLGPALETTIWFRLDDSMGDVTLGGQPARPGDIGKFKFQSTGKTIGKAVLDNNIEDEIRDADGPVRAKLWIEKIRFTAKTGPRAGKLVEYNSAALKIIGPVR